MRPKDKNENSRGVPMVPESPSTSKGFGDVVRPQDNTNVGTRIAEKLRVDAGRVDEMKGLFSHREHISGKFLDKQKTIPVIDKRRVAAFESNITKLLTLINERPTLEEGQNYLDKSGKQPKESDEETTLISQKVQATKAWIERNNAIANVVVTFQDCEDVAQAVLDIGFTCPEIDIAVNRYKAIVVWIGEFYRTIKRLRPLKDEEFPGKDAVKLREINALLDTLATLKVDLREKEDDKVREYFNRAEEVLKSTETFRGELLRLTDVTKLREVRKKHKVYNVDIPELSRIMSRITRNSQIAGTIEVLADIDDLEYKVSELQRREDSFDRSLLREVEIKLEHARRLQSRCRDFFAIERPTLNEEDITSLNILMDEARRHRVRTKELADVERMLQGCCWLESLNAVLQAHEEHSRADPSRQAGLRMPTPVLHRQFQNPAALNSYYKFCRTQLTLLPTEINPDLFDRLRDLCEDAKLLLPLPDARIQEVFTLLSVVVWKELARQFMASKYVSAEELRFLVTDVPASIKEAKDLSYNYLSDLLVKVRGWQEKFNDFVVSDTRSQIFPNLEAAARGDKKARAFLDELSALLDGLYAEFSADLTHFSDLEANGKEVKRYATWIKWGEAAQGVLQDLTNNKRLSDAGDLKNMYDNAVEAQVPKDVDYMSKFDEMHRKVTDLLGDKAKLDASQKAFVEHIASLPPGTLTTISPIELLENHVKRKIPVSRAKEVSRGFKAMIKLVNLDKESDELDRDVEACNAWSTRVKKFLADNEIKDFKKVRVAGLETLLNDTKKLTSEAVNVPFYDDEGDASAIFKFEFRVTALLVYHSTKDKRRSLKEWEQLLKHTDLLTEIDAGLSKTVQSEVATASSLSEEVGRLQQLENAPIKNRSGLKTLDDIKSLRKKVQDSRVGLDTEEKYLAEIEAKANDLISKSEKLLAQGGKGKLEDFASTWEAIRTLPIQLLKTESKLETAVDKASRMTQRLRYSHYVDTNFAETIIREYKTSPILIDDADRIEAAYNQSARLLTELSEEVKKKSEFTWGESKKLAEKLWDIKFNVGNLYPDVKYQVTLARLRALIMLLKSYEGLSIDPPKEDRVTYADIHNLLYEAYTVSKHFEEQRDDLTQLIHFVEKSAGQVETRIAEIHRVRKNEEIDLLKPFVLGCVDLSDIIIEHRQSLANDQDYVPAFERAVISNREKFEALPSIGPKFILYDKVPDLPPSQKMLIERPAQLGSVKKQARDTIPSATDDISRKTKRVRGNEGEEVPPSKFVVPDKYAKRLGAILGGAAAPKDDKKSVERIRFVPVEDMAETTAIGNAVTKQDRVEAVNFLKNSVEGVKHFKLKSFDATNAARHIEERVIYVQYHNDRDGYRRYLSNIDKALKKLAVYPYIARHLQKKLFAAHYFHEIIRMNEDALHKLNRRYYEEHKKRQAERVSQGTQQTEGGSQSQKPPSVRPSQEMFDKLQKKFRVSDEGGFDGRRQRTEPGAEEGEAGFRYSRPPSQRLDAGKRSEGAKRSEGRRSEGRKSFGKRSARGAAGRDAPADGQKGNVVYKVFEGVLKMGEDEIMTTTFNTVHDIKDIVKCPRVASKGQDRWLHVAREVELAYVTKYLDKVRKDNARYIGILGWVEVQNNADNLAKVIAKGNQIFQAGKALQLSYSKHATIFLLERTSFEMNYEKNYSTVLDSRFQQYVNKPWDSKLTFILVSSEHGHAKEYAKIFPEELRPAPLQKEQSALLYDPDQGQFLKGKPKGEDGQIEVEEKSFSKISFLDDYRSLADIISKRNITRKILPLYAKEFNKTISTSTRSSGQQQRGRGRQPFGAGQFTPPQLGPQQGGYFARRSGSAGSVGTTPRPVSAHPYLQGRMTPQPANYRSMYNPYQYTPQPYRMMRAGFATPPAIPRSMYGAAAFSPYGGYGYGYGYYPPYNPYAQAYPQMYRPWMPPAYYGGFATPRQFPRTQSRFPGQGTPRIQHQQQQSGGRPSWLQNQGTPGQGVRTPRYQQGGSTERPTRTMSRTNPQGFATPRPAPFNYGSGVRMPMTRPSFLASTAYKTPYQNRVFSIQNGQLSGRQRTISPDRRRNSGYHQVGQGTGTPPQRNQGFQQRFSGQQTGRRSTSRSFMG